jgi:GntR family negative regulator for fad regulon and positive regulator of fabA
MSAKLERLFRPAQYAEHKLLTSILNGTYPPGETLPSERDLAKQMGVTRPTLRETLKRLASEGWVTIRQGKPTVMKDYWKEGGLGLLSTLAGYGEFLPEGFITSLLEIRVILFPAMGSLAAQNAPEMLSDYLKRIVQLTEKAEVFAEYDWGLQELMARNSNNPVFPLILNDFASVFGTMALPYFSRQEARDVSRAYYQDLSEAINQGGEDVERVVRQVMEKSLALWKGFKEGSSSLDE